MIEADNEHGAVADSFAEVRRVLIAAVEQAERQAQRRAAAHVQQLVEATRACANDLDAQVVEAITQLEEVRTSMAGIQTRLASVAAHIDVVDTLEAEAQPRAAPAPPSAEGPPAPKPAPTVSGEETVRVLRAALDILSRQRNGGH